MKKRSLSNLIKNITDAKTNNEKAISYYNLGLFHDNNNREKEAIPNYKKAIKLGLDRKTKARALAWLASSLYKTGKFKKALTKNRESFKITKEEELKRFLHGLKKRIEK